MKTENLTQVEAIEALIRGEKVQSKYSYRNNYIELIDGELFYIKVANRERVTTILRDIDGYSIYKEPAKPKKLYAYRRPNGDIAFKEEERGIGHRRGIGNRRAIEFDITYPVEGGVE